MHHSFNTSLAENRLYLFLKDRFGEYDVLRHYKSENYPYICDYYIPSRDLYIELNAHWSHGGHWYDANVDFHTIMDWNSKSDYYKNAARTFSKRDVEKRKCAKVHNLNYIVFWNNDLSDATEWFNHDCPDGQDWMKEYSWK